MKIAHIHKLSYLMLMAILTPFGAVFGEEKMVSYADILTRADAAYTQRLDISQASQSLEAYKEAIQFDPEKVEAYWKASRCAWWLGDAAEKKKQKKKYHQLGIGWAKKGIEVDSNSVESHFWLGGNYGSFGEAKGILKSLFLVKPIRKEMETVINLNPAFDGGGGYRVLGVVDYKVPGFAGGNKKRAEERLLKAIDLGPESPFNNYYIAEFYVGRKKYDLARKYLDVLDSLEEGVADAADLTMMRRKAEKLRTKLR